MKKKTIKFLKSTLALCMLVSIFSVLVPFNSVNAKEELVNVALDGEASTTNQTSIYGDELAAVIDGNDQSVWQTPGEWPTEVAIALSGNHNVSKVVVKLGGASGEEYRTVNVEVKFAQNGITSDLIGFGSERGGMNTDVAIESATPVSASHIYVTLSDPLDPNVDPAGFWASIKEIEVYESREETLSDYNNIASQAVISTDGENALNPEYLTDGEDGTLYKFHNAQMTSQKYIDLSFSEARTIDAFRIAFEKVSDEPYAYKFEYSILAKNGDGEYTTIVDHKIGNRTDDWQATYQITETTYSDIRIVMHSCTNVVDGEDGYGWPAIAEFEVYGSEVSIKDDGSIAFNKPVHTSSSKKQALNINDGSKKTAWRGTYYPGYVDIDLEENYYLDTIEVYTPASGYSQYSIYTSIDGRNFDKLVEKSTKEVANEETGEVYQANKKEARIIRVYVEYNSASSAAIINEVRATGTKSNTAIVNNTLTVSDFKDSAYDVTISKQDTIDEVNGIIERRLGANYQSWFSFELANNPNNSDYDYFELSNKNGKINVKGNDGVSLAMGLNHYLKYFCNVNISQVGDQVTMPENIVTLDKTVFKETKVATRYSYNYCTLSYSMAFYGEEQWRNELDWLALNGVNVVLDATAQEEVWRRFLGKLGYQHEDIKDFIAGPAYYAWAYMANLSGFGGPVHDSWFEDRTELARKNQLIMRKLGMQPALQGYSGMVPTDITDYQSDAKVITQGTWCSFQRPSMLETTSDTFDKYADLFYESQKEVYGDVSDYYATDPFHEGGNTGNLSPRSIASEVLDSMLEADSDAVWIIQSWQGNPSNELLAGLQGRREHALVLDLYAEKTPHYSDGGNGGYGYSKEFDGTPWVFCMLNNFGGRLGLHGHLDNLANNIPTALNSSEHMTGIGIAPEASVNNPVLYDFLFETIWQDDASKDVEVIDLDSWLQDYATRRYGAQSDSANQAWTILKDTVYKAQYNGLGQGAPESVVNARPALDINAASTWGNAVISYDKNKLEQAAKLLLADYDKLKDSEGYLYDVATVLQQVLSNSAQEYQKLMTSAYEDGDLSEFTKNSNIFLSIIDDMEKVTSTNEYYLLGRWVEQAKALATNADEFSKDLYEFNAKALITTWGSYNQAETGGLKDYSNRQWSGLIGSFYKVRWQRWIDGRINELSGLDYESNINWFEWEWQWARSNDEFTTTPTTLDLSTLGKDILSKYTVSALGPDESAKDDSLDVDPKTMSAYAENYQPNTEGEGDPKYVLDGDNDTIWHTRWQDTPRDSQYIIFTLDEATKIDGMRFLQRQVGTNGKVTKYTLYTRENENSEWIEISTGKLSTDTAWQKVTFDAVLAKEIKFQVVDAKNDPNTGEKFGSAAEIRFTKVIEDTTINELTNLVSEANKIDSSLYTKASYTILSDTIKEANDLLDNENATKQQRLDMIDAINEAINNLKTRQDNSALKELITYVNNINTSIYTDDSINALKEVVKNGQSVVDNSDATLEEINNAINNINKAIEELEIKKETVNKEELENKVNTVNDLILKLDQSNYTSSSWQALSNAIDNANKVLKDIDATTNDVEEAIKNIDNAYANLEKITVVVPEPEPDTPVTPNTPSLPTTPAKPNSGVSTGDNANIMLFIGSILLVQGVYFALRKKED